MSQDPPTLLAAIEETIATLDNLGGPAASYQAQRLREALNASGSPRGGRRSAAQVEAQVNRVRLLQAYEEAARAKDKIVQAIDILDGPVLDPDRNMDTYLRQSRACALLEEVIGRIPRKV